MLRTILFQSLLLNSVLIYSVQSAESGGMPQLNPEFWVSQIFWLIVSFGSLFIVLSKIVLPKISSNLESRKSQILENIEIAEKQRIDREKKSKEFEKIILERKEKAKKIKKKKKKKKEEEKKKKKKYKKKKKK